MGRRRRKRRSEGGRVEESRNRTNRGRERGMGQGREGEDGEELSGGRAEGDKGGHSSVTSHPGGKIKQRFLRARQESWMTDGLALGAVLGVKVTHNNKDPLFLFSNTIFPLLSVSFSLPPSARVWSTPGPG